MAVLVDGSEIVLSGTVGDLFWEDCFTASDVIVALAQVGRSADVTIRLNSGGGIATEGAAIHSALAAHKGKKTIIVEGIAASAASVIAMAADDLVMALGAIMMIHDPSGFTFGTVAEHEKQIESLTALATAMAGIYADRTKRSVDECRADMREEIWLTPDEAVARGYADRVQAGAASDDAPVPVREPTAFDFRLYAHPPEPLVALADRRAWTNRSRKAARAEVGAPSPTPKPTEEAPMSGSNAAPAGAAAAPQNESNVVDIDRARAEGRDEALKTAMPRAQASEVAKLCHDGGVPEMTASLLSEGASVEQAKGRILAAGQIKDIVALARKANPDIPESMASEMIGQGKTLDQARAALFDKMVARDEATAITSHAPKQRNAGGYDRQSDMNSMRAELKRARLVTEA